MSADVALTATDEEILLYFKIGSVGLDVQTFGNALLSFDELYRAINLVANPGSDIEVDFISSDQGSIRAVVRVFRKDTQTLLKSPVTMIILPILLALIMTKITSDDVKIIVNDDSYVVQHGKEKIVLPKDPARTVSPKEAKRAFEKVDCDPVVRRQVRKFFGVVESDPNVTGVDFRTTKQPNKPVLPVDRGLFATLSRIPEIEPTTLPRTRKEPYRKIKMVVLTAVLDGSHRKWQFLWNGNKISSEIIDEDFFVRLANHQYEFGQGDVLLVDMVAEQELNEVAGAYENKSFSITKVHDHQKGPKQESLL